MGFFLDYIYGAYWFINRDRIYNHSNLCDYTISTFQCNYVTMKTDDLKDRVDGILMELHELENNAARLKQYAYQLSKSIYNINKRLHNIPIPNATEEDNDNSAMETFGKE